MSLFRKLLQLLKELFQTKQRTTTSQPKETQEESEVVVLPMDQLSEHFTLAEMTRSRTAVRKGIDNTPTPDVYKNLQFLCEEVLEPFRKWVAGPVTVSSGYRSPELNAAVGGAKTSAHMQGLACDHVASKVSLQTEVEWWLNHKELPWDQVIYEYGLWIHIGAAAPGNKPRHQALMIFKSTGYLPYDASKIDEAGTGLRET